MTDQVNTLQELKDEADVLGIRYSGNISETTLKQRIEDFKAGEATEEDKLGETAVAEVKAETVEEKYNRLRLEQTKQVRVIIAPMNPALREHTAERFTVSNDIMHESRVVPYHAEWHMTEAMANFIESKTFTYYRKKSTTGEGAQQDAIETRAYTVTRLPPATQEELNEIGKRQLADNL